MVRKLNYRGRSKFKPIKPRPAAEAPDLTQCVCGGVVPVDELDEHRQTCDGTGADDADLYPFGDR